MMNKKLSFTILIISIIYMLLTFSFVNYYVINILYLLLILGLNYLTYLCMLKIYDFIKNKKGFDKTKKELNHNYIALVVLDIFALIIYTIAIYYECSFISGIKIINILFSLLIFIDFFQAYLTIRKAEKVLRNETKNKR